jgi:phospholipid/cholesterol/gamma-HCH transport system ATP-binding protein
MITLSHIEKRFGDHVVLDDISLNVVPGEVLAVIGPSGCGKSTLLRIISGLEVPDAGQIEVTEDNLTMVFQYSALFDSLTVFENVAFSLLEPAESETGWGKRHKPNLAVLRDQVQEKLQLVGLAEDILDLYPSQLSGGMQKRVSFARAIISNPRIILYDEPTAGLDPIAATMIENHIRVLQHQLGATSIVVTHHLSTIRHVADRVCLLFGGHVQWCGPSAEFFTTTNPYARQFAQASLEGPMAVNLHFHA